MSTCLAHQNLNISSPRMEKDPPIKTSKSESNKNQYLPKTRTQGKNGTIATKTTGSLPNSDDNSSDMNGISVVTQATLTPRRFTCWTGREPLKPAVQDLSGQLKPPSRSLSSSSDEDGPQSFLTERHNALTCRPFLTQRLTHRGSGYLTTKVDNPIHRQNVQRSARLRSRLNYTRSRSADQMITPVPNQNADTEDLMALQIARSVDRSRDSGQGQMYSQPTSRLSHREYIPLSRPATTTGRYFDSANGLRGRNLLQNRRPQTAGSWLASGLKIQRIKLHSKNEFGVKLDVSSKDR